METWKNIRLNKFGVLMFRIKGETSDDLGVWG